MQLVLIIAAAGVCLALHLITCLYRDITSSLSSIPGPWIARITRLWYLHRVAQGSFHHENFALHRKYGPIVRVGPDLFSINVPDKNVYGIGSKFRKSDWYEGWKHPSPERWGLFADQDIKRHAETRKKFQGLYSMSSLLSYEKYVDDCADLFNKRLADFERAGQPVNMVHWFQCYAFDVMGNLTYSERFGFLDHGEDIEGTLAALDTAGAYSTLIGIYAWLHPYIYRLMELVPGNGASGRTYLMNFVQRKIEARERERTSGIQHQEPSAAGETLPRDFLDKLRDAHLDNPQKVTKYHLFMMGLSNIIAGSDTTAISLSSVLFYLVSNPSTIKALRQEIVDFRKTNPSQGTTLTLKAAQELPYLQAVIKEALRLHPATGLPLWRVVPEGGATIAGHFFPEGQTVGLNSWVAHRDRTIFGEDADEFRPERWLPTDSQSTVRIREMDAYYMPVSLYRDLSPVVSLC